MHQMIRDDTTAELTSDSAGFKCLTTGSATSPAKTSFARIMLNIRVDSANGFWDRWDDISFGPAGSQGIEMDMFTGEAVDDHTVRLFWRTSSEQDLLSWRAERSDDGVNFILLKTFPAINRPDGCSYEFVDHLVTAGEYRYRLISVDISGGQRFYGPVAVRVGLPERFDLAQNRPNPFADITAISYQLSTLCRVRLSIIMWSGKG
ncbi:MAG: hypothetical protein QME74_08250 [Candidatus Edwardsbacteria bacterium]|nr:hypothetical protein [Candidatus Edwardsbacteria bacterium]